MGAVFVSVNWSLILGFLQRLAIEVKALQAKAVPMDIEACLRSTRRHAFEERGANCWEEFQHHVQITAAETVGVEHRGKFYEKTGALRVKTTMTTSTP